MIFAEESKLFSGGVRPHSLSLPPPPHSSRVQPSIFKAFSRRLDTIQPLPLFTPLPPVPPVPLSLGLRLSPPPGPVAIHAHLGRPRRAAGVGVCPPLPPPPSPRRTVRTEVWVAPQSGEGGFTVPTPRGTHLRGFIAAIPFLLVPKYSFLTPQSSEVVLFLVTRLCSVGAPWFELPNVTTALVGSKAPAGFSISGIHNQTRERALDSPSCQQTDERGSLDVGAVDPWVQLCGGRPAAPSSISQGGRGPVQQLARTPPAAGSSAPGSSKLFSDVQSKSGFKKG